MNEDTQLLKQILFELRIITKMMEEEKERQNRTLLKSEVSNKLRIQK